MNVPEIRSPAPKTAPVKSQGRAPVVDAVRSETDAPESVPVNVPASAGKLLETVE
ncbi:MAG: hypothetical protein HY002_07635 [Candidatus Rokubacteria bacterium]|nr:hypothetical protein [Candidatus Rokubacteria bacterium]